MGLFKIGLCVYTTLNAIDGALMIGLASQNDPRLAPKLCPKWFQKALEGVWTGVGKDLLDEGPPTEAGDSPSTFEVFEHSWGRTSSSTRTKIIIINFWFSPRSAWHRLSRSNGSERRTHGIRLSRRCSSSSGSTFRIRRSRRAWYPTIYPCICISAITYTYTYTCADTHAWAYRCTST